MRKHKVEILSAGCPMCKEVIRLVEHLSEGTSAVEVLDVRQASAAEYAKALGIHAFPAAIIDGKAIAFDVGKALVQALELAATHILISRRAAPSDSRSVSGVGGANPRSGAAFRLIDDARLDLLPIHLALKRYRENLFITDNKQQFTDGVDQKRAADAKLQVVFHLPAQFGSQFPVDIV